MHSEETTALLLDRANSGDDAAREQLVARYLPMLRRWVHGRLPASTRDLTDTDDLVQVTLVRVLKQTATFDYAGARAASSHISAAR